MTECKGMSGRIVRLVRLYEDSPYGPELSIDFEDGTNFTATLHTRHLVEGKLSLDQGGEPIILERYVGQRSPT